VLQTGAVLLPGDRLCLIGIHCGLACGGADCTGGQSIGAEGDAVGDKPEWWQKSGADPAENEPASDSSLAR
jgi:hypothetical protein